MAALDSPLRSLLIVPVVFAGLLYPPAYVVGTALAATLGPIAVTTTDPGVVVEWHFVMIGFAVLVGVGLCSLVASIGRMHLHGEADRLNAELKVLATTDPLTGCLNRRSFDAVCRSEAARALRHARKLTLMMVDVDKQKRINDTGGHAAGDHALTNIGAALMQTSRAGDAVARLGGDEFASLTPDADPAGAIDRGRRIRSELQRVPDIELMFSCGVCDVNSERTTLAGLSEVADHALYAAKRAGGDAVARPCDEDSALLETIQMSSSGCEWAPGWNEGS